MLAQVSGTEVVGAITPGGKCPACNERLRKYGQYPVFTKSRGIVDFENGEQCSKCPRCGKFVMLPRNVA